MSTSLFSDFSLIFIKISDPVDQIFEGIFYLLRDFDNHKLLLTKSLLVEVNKQMQSFQMHQKLLETEHYEGFCIRKYAGVESHKIWSRYGTSTRMVKCLPFISSPSMWIRFCDIRLPHIFEYKILHNALFPIIFGASESSALILLVHLNEKDFSEKQLAVVEIAKQVENTFKYLIQWIRYFDENQWKIGK